MKIATWKVLIVDDEPAIHTIINQTLLDTKVHNTKITIFHAHNAQEAHALLQKHIPT